MSRQYHKNASNSEQRERVTWLIEEKNSIHKYKKNLNVKARAYDTGFGNPSNISSTI
jgi:hypothetical protein